MCIGADLMRHRSPHHTANSMTSDNVCLNSAANKTLKLNSAKHAQSTKPLIQLVEQ